MTILIVLLVGSWLLASTARAEVTDLGFWDPNSSTCPDVLFVGVRGSGQWEGSAVDFGPQVWMSYKGFLERLREGARSDITVGRFEIPYDAMGVDWNDVVDGIFGDTRRDYFESYYGGIRLMDTLMRGISCTSDQTVIVASGYSQGAHVLHRGVVDHPSWPLQAVLLIADPVKSVPELGTAVTWGGGFDSNGGALGSLAYPASPPWWGLVCHDGDAVCDPFPRLNGVHTDLGAYADVLMSGGRWLASSALSRLDGIHRGDPEPPPTDPTPTSRKINLLQGSAATSGYWYSIAASGFSPGSLLTLTCHDSVDPGGFRSHSYSVDSSGSVSTSSMCYSGDGPGHWVTGGGIESNHVSWGSGGTTPTPTTSTTSPPPSASPSGPDVLQSGMTLYIGDSVTSADGNYILHMQSDGNVVFKHKDTTVWWATGTEKKGAHRLRMQKDGNLVVYTSAGNPLWASNTAGNPGAYAVVGDRLRIYDAYGKLLRSYRWSSPAPGTGPTATTSTTRPPTTTTSTPTTTSTTRPPTTTTSTPTTTTNPGDDADLEPPTEFSIDAAGPCPSWAGGEVCLSYTFRDNSLDEAGGTWITRGVWGYGGWVDQLPGEGTLYSHVFVVQDDEFNNRHCWYAVAMATEAWFGDPLDGQESKRVCVTVTPDGELIR